MKIIKFTIIFVSFLISMRVYAFQSQRIISLKPNITEILFAIGAGNKVVGVTSWCNRPKEATRLPKVADYIKPNVEKIITLRPDLVITSEENSTKKPITAIKKTGIDVLILPFNNIHNLLDSITLIGKKSGHFEEATGLKEQIMQEIQEITKTKKRKKTVMIVGKRPLIAAGSNTYLNELLTLAGGKNIITSRIAYPHINMETIFQNKPEIIVDFSMGSEDDSIKNVKEYWKKFNLEAVENGGLYVLNISDFRIGSDLPNQLRKLKRIIKNEKNYD